MKYKQLTREQRCTISLEKSNERGKIMMAALVFNDL